MRFTSSNWAVLTLGPSVAVTVGTIGNPSRMDLRIATKI